MASAYRWRHGLTRAMLKARQEKRHRQGAAQVHHRGPFHQSRPDDVFGFRLVQAAHRRGAENLCDDRNATEPAPGIERRPGPLQRRDHRHDAARPRRDIARKARQAAGRAQDRPAGGILQGQDGYVSAGSSRAVRGIRADRCGHSGAMGRENLRSAARSARHQEEGRHAWRRSGRDGEGTGEGQGNRTARISRTRQKEEAAAGAPGAADRDRRAELSRRIQYRDRAGVFSGRERTVTTWTSIGLYDGAGVHRRSRLAQRATLRRAGPAGGDR